jgi:hypothetical protein
MTPSVEAQANSSVAAQTDRPANRLLYLDNLRMVVITLVVVMHGDHTAEGAWYYHEAGRRTLVFVIMMLQRHRHGLVMGLLPGRGLLHAARLRSQRRRAFSGRPAQAAGPSTVILWSGNPADPQLPARCA